jgi:hypothetical protein
MRADCLVQRILVLGQIRTQELPFPRHGSNPARSSLRNWPYPGRSEIFALTRPGLRAPPGSWILAPDS